jgi:hypothetical protein
VIGNRGLGGEGGDAAAQGRAPPGVVQVRSRQRRLAATVPKWTLTATGLARRTSRYFRGKSHIGAARTGAGEVMRLG